MALIIAGLGPGDPGMLTMGTVRLLRTARALYLRTDRHPVVDWLKAQGIRYSSFDEIYESEPDFDSVYGKIVNTILGEASRRDVVYAVPGSPFVAERTVDMLIRRCAAGGVECRVEPAVSFLDAVSAALGVYPGELEVIDALDPGPVNASKGCIVVQVYDALTASQVKLHLARYFPDEHPVTVVRAAGCDGQTVRVIPLFELDRQKDIDHLTSVYVPPLEATYKPRHTLGDLVDIMARLRGENGCPWDLKQTHESLKPYLLEEAYEVLENIDARNMDGLCDELGDVLLQVVFHARIACENGDFDMGDVITNICHKMIRRHPHIFGDVKADTPEKVLSNWEQIKQSEKGLASYTSGLKDVPKHMPSLLRACKVQQKAALVGFDWEKVDDAFKKLEEELGELKEVYNTGNRDKINEELGDLLFAAVNVARFLKIHPELALKDTINKFISRFAYIEQHASKNLKDMSLEEMDDLWNQSKIMKKHKNYYKNRYN